VRTGRGHGLILAAILLLGGGLRLAGLADRPIWVDEGFSLLYATIDWTEVVELRRVGTNPPLYHFLLSLWVDAFGPTALSMRSLSAIFGIGSILAGYFLARRLLGPAVGLMTAGLLAVSNLAIAYSQEARFYALTQLLSIVSSLALCGLIDRRRWRDALIYALLMAVLVWVHTFGWFVLAAHGVWGLAAATRRGRRERWHLLGLGAAAFAFVVISFLPWVSILREQVQGVLEDYWIAEPSWWVLADSVRVMLVTGEQLRWWVATAALLVLLYCAIRTRRKRPPVPRTDTQAPPRLPHEHAWGLLAWFVLPIAIPFVWSKIGQPVYQVKYAIVAQAPALLLLAWLMVRQPAIGWPALAAICMFLPANADRGLIVEEFPQAAKLLQESANPEEPIFVYKDYAAFALRYYFDQPHRLTPVTTKGKPAGPFARFYNTPPIPYGQMLQQIKDRSIPRQWLVLRWGSFEQRAALYEELRALRTVTLVGEFRSVDVACLTLRE
jgi:hypothetical protein